MPALVQSVSLLSRAPTRVRVYAIGVVIVMAFSALPLVVPPRAIGTLIQMQVASVFALAFNILWRQTRLLSFGHAAFFGTGMFATIHLMRAQEIGAALVPLPLLPLAGLAAGGLLGIVIGYFATARTGTYFAMVTLAFAEVIHQIAPQWEGLFGGEAGLSTIRMPWAGISFGSNIEVYYFVLVWFLIAVGGMYAFARMPLGRLAFALGDNEVRVRFLGYNARRAKTLVFAVSAMFAGLAGGLLAVTNENVDYSVFAASTSGLVVIHTFVGGAELFLGPIVGAIGLVLFSSVVSDVTRLWMLYQGVLFVLVVMYMPQGVAGLLLDNLAPARWRILSSRAIPILSSVAGGVLIAAGAIFSAEVVSALVSNPFAIQVLGAGGPTVVVFGLSWSAHAVATWFVPGACFALGALLVWLAIRRVPIAEVTSDFANREDAV